MRQETQYLTWGSIACRQSTSSLWRRTHLVAHALIGITRLALHKGAIRTNTRWGYTSHEQSTRVAFRGSHGEKAQEPLTITLGVATNNHQLVPILLRCSKLSRWRQPPRVTRKPQQERSPSATRCNHSSKCTRNLSQSHFGWTNQEQD